MPAFNYQYTPSQEANTIASLLMQGGQTAAQAATTAAALQAQGMTGAGNTWQQGLNQLGQLPMQYQNLKQQQQQQQYQNMIMQLLGGGLGYGGVNPYATPNFTTALTSANPLGNPYGVSSSANLLGNPYTSASLFDTGGLGLGDAGGLGLGSSGLASGLSTPYVAAMPTGF